MKIQNIVIVIVSLFTASVASAQYYYGPPPGPPGPPPVSPGPPPGPPGYYGPPWPAGMGPYFRMGLGPTFFQNSMIKEFFSPADPSIPYNGVNGPPGKVNYDVGVSFDGAFGWAFNKYVGLDFQTGYIWGHMNSVQNYQENDSDMGNVPFLADVTLSLPIPHTNIVPYIGGGGGGADSIFDAHHFEFQPTGDYIDGSEADVVFAYQAFAGVRFMLGPNISLGIGYRYFATGNPSFTYSGGSLPPLNTEFQGVRTHSIMFTFQANF